MKTRRIADLPRATDLVITDETPVALADEQLQRMQCTTVGEIKRGALIDFYRSVCARAEANMEATGTVSGAHWNAMRQILVEMGIQVDAILH